jgi:hypothetical protein
MKSDNKHCGVYFGHEIFEDPSLLGCDAMPLGV